MKEYVIFVREVHISHRLVEADSLGEAFHKVKKGEGQEHYLEYSYTLGPETWSGKERGVT